MLDDIDRRDEIECIVRIRQTILDNIALVNLDAFGLPHPARGMLLLIQHLGFGAVKAVDQVQFVVAQPLQHHIVDAASTADIEKLHFAGRCRAAQQCDIG